MPARRIIPCLDVRDGRVVKGIQFEGHRDAGDIVEQAMRYRQEKADELVFYDIAASAENRTVSTAWIGRVAQVIDIPFCVAGGIRSVADAAACLEAGADKISINSPALERPQLIEEVARAFGSQCVVVGVDTLKAQGDYVVHQFTGSAETRRDTGRRTIEWVREVAERGAGEIVLNCMGKDGVRSGYDIAHTQEVIGAVQVPVIASGGAGLPSHFRAAFDAGASGALAATVFHDRLIFIPDLKEYLGSCGIEVRR